MNVIPSNYKESIFAPLQKKEIDLMDVEQSMIHSVFQDGTTVVHAGLIFFFLLYYITGAPSIMSPQVAPR